MPAFDVSLGNVEVAAGHSHIAVTEDVLEGEGVAAVAQVGDGEGVSETVGVDVGDIGTFAETGHQFIEGVFAERVFVF